MLIWIIALHCEAKPVIDLYRLKKSPDHRAFDLYQNDSMQCVISGIGKINAAAATAWVAALNHHETSIGWINLGTAGNAELSIGDSIWVNKIADNQSNKQLFPVPTFNHPMQSKACISLDAPSFEYQNETLYDMEASAFFTVASRFSSAEFIHCIKVISDNANHLTGLDKPAISALIAAQMSTISEFADKLLALDQQQQQLEVDPKLWRRLMQQAHFSQTQQSQLKKSLRFLINRSDHNNLLESVSGLSSSRDILQTLDKLCLDQSRNL